MIPKNVSQDAASLALIGLALVIVQPGEGASPREEYPPGRAEVGGYGCSAFAR